MKMYTLENEILKVSISDHGAEIRSIIRKDDGKELMWQADPAFWGRTSPVLFPLVGNYYQKKSIYNGKTYEMGQHGFARDMDFALVLKDEENLAFELKSDASTMEKYPFDFLLRISYRLVENTVNVRWQVKNVNDTRMYFSIGGHPAFNCDLNTYSLRFEKVGECLNEIKAAVISSDGSGCLSEQVDLYKLNEGLLPMSDSLFDKDALIIQDNQADAVTLIDEYDNDVLTLIWQAPLFGVWSPVKKQAPFVCIEPWYGRCDRVGFNGQLSEREYSNELDAGEEFDESYCIVVND